MVLVSASDFIALALILFIVFTTCYSMCHYTYKTDKFTFWVLAFCAVGASFYLLLKAQGGA